VVDRRFWATSETVDAEDTEVRANKPTYVQELEEKLAVAETRLNDTLQKHRDAVREFENARARLARDVAQETERHKRTILVDLLDVLDNLDRAAASAKEDTEVATLAQGVTLVRDHFLAKLEGFGVRRSESLGEVFDPSRHEAVSTVPAAAEDDGKVVGVIKEAYMLGDEVLRPATVAVARAQSEEEDAS
jgi:molecular chaperone GrpE